MDATYHVYSNCMPEILDHLYSFMQRNNVTPNIVTGHKVGWRDSEGLTHTCEIYFEIDYNTGYSNTAYIKAHTCGDVPKFYQMVRKFASWLLSSGYLV